MKKIFTITRDPYPLEVSLFYKEEIPQKGYLLYFHGGGLLYGSRDDLPEETVSFFCENGLAIFTFDYGLAPYTRLPGILEDMKDGINWFLENTWAENMPYPWGTKAQNSLPWFLWGRSAGAYLCLIGTLLKQFPYPEGILSYYGYGFLEPGWYQEPSPYYRQFPAMDPPDLSRLALDGPCLLGPLEKRYCLYLSARQTGNWIPSFYEGKQKDFLREYTFLLKEIPEDFPPVFLTHALQDPDVPFGESRRLSQILPDAVLQPVSAAEHDFDRNPDSFAARNVLEKTLDFVIRQSRNIEKIAS